MVKKFIQKAVKLMEKNGKKGSFTKIAKEKNGIKKDGSIKKSFIEKEIKSKNPVIRKKAQFVKNINK